MTFYCQQNKTIKLVGELVSISDKSLQKQVQWQITESLKNVNTLQDNGGHMISHKQKKLKYDCTQHPLYNTMFYGWTFQML